MVPHHAFLRDTLPIQSARQVRGMGEQASSDAASYEIKVEGHLDESWASWFDGLTIETGFEEDGSPVSSLAGPLADQAALHGVLTKIRDLGLRIRSVNRLEPTSENDQS